MNNKYRDQHISAFDLDHTILTINSSYKFGAYLYKHQYFSFLKMLNLTTTYGAHKAGVLTIPQLHESIFQKLFFQKPFDQIQTFALAFTESEAAKHLYSPAIAALEEAKRNGHHTILLSSSPHFIVDPIARLLGFDNSESTHYEIDKQRQFCKISSIMQGEFKAATLKKISALLNVPKANVTAYTDSHLDLPFLKAAGKCVGVNPNRQLKKICLQNKWLII